MTEEQNKIPNSPDDGISLSEIVLVVKDWFLYFKTKWILICLIGLTGAGIGFWYASIQKPVYTSKLSFVLEEDKGSSGGLGGALGLASQFGFDVGGGGVSGVFSGNNLMELMKSRTIVEKALLNPITVNGKTTSYAQYFINTKMKDALVTSTELQKLQFLPNASRDGYSRQQDSLLEKIYLTIINSNLTISQKDKKISIIIIEMKDQDEVFAKNFTENIAQEVSDFYIETKSKKAKLNVAILQKQTDSIRAELNSAMTGVAIANDQTYNLNPALNINRVPSAKRQIDVQANSALLTQLIVNLEVAKANLRKETPLIQIIDRPMFPLDKEKVSRKKYLLIGGTIAGLLIIIILVIWRMFSKLMGSLNKKSLA